MNFKPKKKFFSVQSDTRERPEELEEKIDSFTSQDNINIIDLKFISEKEHDRNEWRHRAELIYKTKDNG